MLTSLDYERDANYENLALQVTSWGKFKFHESTKDISTLKSHKIIQTSRK